jgi:hypothetical protein
MTTIFGTVLSKDGFTPIPNADMTLCIPARPRNFITSTRTDDNGNYKFALKGQDEVAEASVLADCSGHCPQEHILTVFPNRNHEEDFLLRPMPDSGICW